MNANAYVYVCLSEMKIFPEMKFYFLLILISGKKIILDSWLTLMSSKKSIDQIMITGQYYFGPITSRTSRECPTTNEHIQHRKWSYA